MTAKPHFIHLENFPSDPKRCEQKITTIQTLHNAVFFQKTAN
jgi:carbamoylphosphate synthase small subunit